MGAYRRALIRAVLSAAQPFADREHCEHGVLIYSDYRDHDCEDRQRVVALVDAIEALSGDLL